MKAALLLTVLLLAACTNNAPRNSPPVPAANAAPAAPERAAPTDPAEAAAQVELPRLDAAGLPPAALDQQRPWLALCLRHQAGPLARVNGDAAWRECGDDGALAALVARHGEMDFDVMQSSLQVILAVDARTAWENVLAAVELLAGQGVRAIFALARAGAGTCLLDLSLPMGKTPPPEQVAELDVSGEGEALRVTLGVAGKSTTHNGPGALGEAAAAARGTHAKVLRVRVPRATAAGLFFAALEAMAPLGFAGVTIAA